MDNDENKLSDDQINNNDQAPADALSQEPDALAADAAVDDIAASDKPQIVSKKPSKLKAFFKKINLYLLLFILLLLIASVFAVVNYLKSRDVTPVAPNIASQTLTQESLEELAQSDVSVGASNRTFTVKGNADIEGQTLIRGNLNVAGTMQSAGALTVPSLTVGGQSNLRDTQIQSLQVAQSITVRGDSNVQRLNVSGTSSFNGAITANQISTSNLILSGNATLTIPNHISFAGPNPTRTINHSIIGNGGSASVGGSDAAGSVDINTGTNPKSGCMLRVNFNRSYSKTPRVIISPVGAAAGRLNFYSQRSTTGFDICSTNPPSGGSHFSFDYLVTN